MHLKITRLVLGPLQNNVYFLSDEEAQQAVVIDPSFEPQQALDLAAKHGWVLKAIWLTHGHYDHTVGSGFISRAFKPSVPIAMHSDAFAWAAAEHEVTKFGFPIEPVPQVDIPLIQGQHLSLDPAGVDFVAEVREVPGHNPGSVIFYVPSLACAFVGDAIFRESIGRTDFRGGDHSLLLKSIHEQIFTLPNETTLLPGHGPETSVAHEKRFNPYLAR